MTLTATSEMLRTYTQNEQLLEELHAYTENGFRVADQGCLVRPLADEPQVTTWEAYVKEAATVGAYNTLNRHLVPFQFPVRTKINETSDYQAATRRGASTVGMEGATGLALQRPEELELFLYESIAGRIPVIVTAVREDFESIISALCYRNEPHPIPGSMGAVLVRGLNNWDRVRQVRIAATLGTIKGDWRQQRELYQDSIIVLSRIPYSNVPAQAVQLSEEEWLEQSLHIRLAHECAHYYTLRQFGNMAANMHDELIADYMGICAVQPRFNANWFLRFIGLENYPECRRGGRIHNYLGTPPISDASSEVLQTILYRAAQNVAAFDEQIDHDKDPRRLMRLQVLCSLNLVEMAAPNGLGRLLDHYYESLKKV